MTPLMTRQDMRRPLQPRHPGTAPADNRTPSPVASIRHWLLSISEVAVKHGYASPWEQDDRRSGMIATGRR